MMMMMMIMMMMIMIDILFILKIFITITTITGDDEYYYNHHNDNYNKNNVNHHHHRHHHFEHLLCPSSSVIDFNIDGYFTYPIDLFYPKYFDSLLSDINYHHHQQHDNKKSVNNHNYSHYFNKKKNHQIYHHSFTSKTSNIDELLKYIHDNSNITGSPHYDLNYHHSHYVDDNNEDGDDPYNIEVYNCSKPDYDNANIKYHPHSHHVCVTNRLFKCPISIHDIIDATNFMINHDDHYHKDNDHHHQEGYDNYSNQHEYDNQDDNYKQPLHTLHVRSYTV